MKAKRDSKAKRSSITPKDSAVVTVRKSDEYAPEQLPAPKLAEPPDSAHLKGEDWQRATNAVHDIHYAACSMLDLARHCHAADPANTEAYFLAIENTAKVVALKTEVLCSLLNDGPGFGSFDDEFRIGGANG